MRKLIPLFLVFMAATPGCKEMVRLPALSTAEPTCVPPEENGDLKKSRDPARLHAFIRRNTEASVAVRNRTYEADGLRTHDATGALIGNKGLVLTTWDAVRRSEFLTVAYRRVTKDGATESFHETPAEIITISREYNIVVLRLKMPLGAPPPFPLRHGPMALGDDVWWFGVTTASGKMRVTKTDVAIGHNTTGLVIVNGTLRDADIGAPMVNACGELVGILLYNDRKGVYALPIDNIFQALNLRTQDLY